MPRLLSFAGNELTKFTMSKPKLVFQSHIFKVGFWCKSWARWKSLGEVQLSGLYILSAMLGFRTYPLQVYSQLRDVFLQSAYVSVYLL